MIPGRATWARHPKEPMHPTIERLCDNIEKVVIGQRPAVEALVRCLLARGHALIEDVPGVGKTVLATALARSVDAAFSRIQLTPDLLPSDVLGVSVYNRDTGAFEFKRGPIFANVVLADEINRTTPRTQTALLEAMNEANVSVDGKVIPLDPPFMLLATQNPYEFEGTYLLPENQLDRFLVRIRLGYPSAEAEARVLHERPSTNALRTLGPVITTNELLALQDDGDRVHLAPSLIEYIVELAQATRDHEAIRVGISPRGSLALAQAARVTALMDGRDHVTPEDIIDNAVPVWAHRLVLRAGPTDNAGAAEGVIEAVLTGVASPA